MPDLLGAQMSIAGGVYRALERGLEVSCPVGQIFLKNQLQWTAAPCTEEDMRRFRPAWKATRMRTVFTHSSYLINLATPAKTEEQRKHRGPHRLRTSVGVGAPVVHRIVAEIPAGSLR
jgi:endonuclease IV